MSASIFECIEHIVPAQHIRQYYRATSNSQEEELQICVKQYKPRRAARPGDVTILAAGANATPKETYEPLWDAIHNRFEEQGIGIRSIWTMDPANQGASGILNEGKLGDEPSITDSARDWLHIVNHFRKEMHFPIVGFGHSIGAGILVNLALMHPRLICSVALVECAMYPTPPENQLVGMSAVLRRPDSWSSRDEAMKDIQKEMCRGWYGRALEAFRDFGLRDIPGSEGRVVLTTSKDVEILSAARSSLPSQHVEINGKRLLPRLSHADADESTRLPDSPYYRGQHVRTTLRLPHLRPSCIFIYGGDSKMVLPQVEANKCWRRVNTGVGNDGSGGQPEGRVKEAHIEGGSHSVPQQRPDEVGRTIADWWSTELERWRRETGEQARAWEAVPAHRKMKMSQEYIDAFDEANRRDRERFQAAAAKAKKKKEEKL